MTKWEYHSIISQTCVGDQALNVFGKEGWELFSILFDRPLGWVYHFKRQEPLKLKGK